MPRDDAPRMVKLAIEFENPAPEWWENGGRELWEGISEAFDGSAVLIDAAMARSWLAQAATIPGWEGGPAYAPHPIYEKALDEDEEL